MTDISNNETTEPVKTGSGSSPTGDVGHSILSDHEQFPSLGGNVHTVSSSQKMQSVSSSQKMQSVSSSQKMQPVSSSQKMQPVSSSRKIHIDDCKQKLAIIEREIRKVKLEELEAVKAELEKMIANQSQPKTNSYASITNSTSVKHDLSPVQEFGPYQIDAVRAMLFVLQSMKRWKFNEKNRVAFINGIEDCIKKMEITEGTLNSTNIGELLMFIETHKWNYTWIRYKKINNFRAKPSDLKCAWGKITTKKNKKKIIRLIANKCKVSESFLHKVIAEIDAFAIKAKKAKKAKKVKKSVDTESVETESVEAESDEAESDKTESVEAESVEAESNKTESVEIESVEAEKSVETESVKAINSGSIWMNVGHNWNPPESKSVTNIRKSSIGHGHSDNKSVHESCYNYYNGHNHSDDDDDDDDDHGYGDGDGDGDHYDRDYRDDHYEWCRN